MGTLLAVLVLPPLAAGVVLYVTAVQGPPPEAITLFRELVGVFGLPGAIAWGLWGWLAVQKLRGGPASPNGELAVLKKLNEMAEDAKRGNKLMREDLADDIRDAIMSAGEEFARLTGKQLSDIREDLERDRQRRAS